MEHNNEGLEDDFPLQMGDFQVPCSFSSGVDSFTKAAIPFGPIPFGWFARRQGCYGINAISPDHGWNAGTWFERIMRWHLDENQHSVGILVYLNLVHLLKVLSMHIPTLEACIYIYIHVVCSKT